MLIEESGGLNLITELKAEGLNMETTFYFKNIKTKTIHSCRFGQKYHETIVEWYITGKIDKGNTVCHPKWKNKKKSTSIGSNCGSKGNDDTNKKQRSEENSSDYAVHEDTPEDELIPVDPEVQGDTQDVDPVDVEMQEGEADTMESPTNEDEFNTNAFATDPSKQPMPAEIHISFAQKQTDEYENSPKERNNNLSKKQISKVKKCGKKKTRGRPQSSLSPQTKIPKNIAQPTVESGRYPPPADTVKTTPKQC